MRTFATLLLAYLLSGLIAGMVQLQIGIAFKADMELVIAMIVLAAMTLVTTIALGIALGTAASIVTVDRVATVLLGFTVLAILALMVFEFIDTRSIVIRRASLAILIEIAIPTIIMITIQWWLVRRRWRKTHTGAESAAMMVEHTAMDDRIEDTGRGMSATRTRELLLLLGVAPRQCDIVPAAPHPTQHFPRADERIRYETFAGAP